MTVFNNYKTKAESTTLRPLTTPLGARRTDGCSDGSLGLPTPYAMIETTASATFRQAT
jgi:hypothetical protein